MDTHSDQGAFTLPEDVLQIQQMARDIVRNELLPLEKQFLLSKEYAHGVKETLNLRYVYDGKTADRLEGLAKETGLFYLLVPEEHGGTDLSMLARIVAMEEFMYTAVPFPFANVPNILYGCTGEQIEKYLKPVVNGEKTTAFAQTEPDAGSDPGGMMRTKAVKDGNDWVINGTKMWISNAAESDLLLVQAVTDPEKRQRGGITMFLVDRNNPGVKIEEPDDTSFVVTGSGRLLPPKEPLFLGNAGTATRFLTRRQSAALTSRIFDPAR